MTLFVLTQSTEPEAITAVPRYEDGAVALRVQSSCEADAVCVFAANAAKARASAVRTRPTTLGHLRVPTISPPSGRKTFAGTYAASTPLDWSRGLANSLI
jgi:hypothetical protein